MIEFSKFELANGLRVIHHYDPSTPLAVMNILYNVGSRDENPEKTGFAHLFEHLMFGGSVNIPDFDGPLQAAGGENNAFTNTDITNYYLTLPANNIETGFWLESDRMLSLAFGEKSLEVQRKVVIEEFKQRYLNQPYGDVWLKMRDLAYTTHPYKWATIGKEIKHIEEATLEDVKAFFKKFYNPNNAIMCIAGGVKIEEVKELCEKWFGDIPKNERNQNLYPAEPVQTEARSLTVKADVPANAIYKAYHCVARSDAKYYSTDLLSDVLSRSNSSRLYTELLKNQGLFSDINAYVTGEIDKGLFVVAGRLVDGVSMETAEKAILEQLALVQNELVSDEELEKVKNQVETTVTFSEISILNKAMGFCYGELLGNVNLINEEVDMYKAITKEEIQARAKELFRPENCSTIYYHTNN